MWTLAAAAACVVAGAAAGIVTGPAPAGGTEGVRVGAVYRPETIGRSYRSCERAASRVKVTGVRKATSIEGEWTAYADSGTGWTGGDSVHAYTLPAGGILWAFADSFLPPLNASGGRPFTAPLVHNLLVVQSGTSFRLLVNGSLQYPSPLVNPTSSRDFYLTLAGAIEGETFQEILMEIHRLANGQFHWEQSATVIATFALPALNLVSVHRLSQPNLQIQWGAYLLHDGGYTYIYGASSRGSSRGMYVARTRSTDLDDPWTYFDGRGWTTRASAAAAIEYGVPPQFSVVPYDGMYILVASSLGAKFSNEVNVLAGCSPLGPFHLRSTFAASYYVGPYAKSIYGSSEVWDYEAMDQAVLNKGHDLLVSYNRNSLDYWDLFRNAKLYRPGYLRVTLSR